MGALYFLMANGIRINCDASFASSAEASTLRSEESFSAMRAEQDFVVIASVT